MPIDKLPFSTILEQLDELSSEDLERLESRARSLRSSRKGVQALRNFEQSMRESRRCPHCGMDKAYRHGRDSRGTQRFRCRPPSQRGCGRTFNEGLERRFRACAGRRVGPSFCRLLRLDIDRWTTCTGTETWESPDGLFGAGAMS
ncbi:MAG: hypothetical protein OXG08_06125 [Gammaproteobacteria bacterium]|nr:hypothetical protein [Gammaproteobacteria bacterium]